MIAFWGLAAALGSLALSALFSGSETGIYCVNRVRLRLQSDQGHTAAVRLRRLLENEQQALAAILVGNSIVNYLTTVSAAAVIKSQLGGEGRRLELLTTALVTPALFVFGELLPKSVFQQAPDRLLYAVSLPLMMARTLLWPAAWCIQCFSQLVMAVVAPGQERRRTLDHRERVAGLLREALADSGHSQQHGQFVQSVLRLADTPIWSVMVPAREVIAAPAAADRNAFLTLVRRYPHTRFPVCQDDQQRVVGIVHTRVLLSDPDWGQVGERVKPVPRLSPNTSVAAALVQMSRAGSRMAVVENPDGRLAGLVTLQDLFEEIVGELEGG